MDPLVTWMEMWPYYFIHAARLAAEATFSLDGRTTKALGRIAKRWKVPRSEALRRAVLMAERSHR